MPLNYGKGKKDGKFLNCYIRSDVMEYLNKFCEETGFSKTTVVEKALLQYLDNDKENGVKKPPDKSFSQ